MLWNILSIWFAAVLLFRMFIVPSFLPDDTSEEELDKLADDTIWYSKVCLGGVIICNIVSMFI